VQADFQTDFSDFVQGAPAGVFIGTAHLIAGRGDNAQIMLIHSHYLHILLNLD